MSSRLIPRITGFDTHVKIFAVCVCDLVVITTQVFIYRDPKIINTKRTLALLSSQKLIFIRTASRTGLNNVLRMSVTSLVWEALLRRENHLIKSRKRNSANTLEVQVLLRNFK